MVNEIIGEAAQQAISMQPTAAAQQAAVNKVVQQRIASQAQQPATEMDKVLAMMQTTDLKTQTNQAYGSTQQTLTRKLDLQGQRFTKAQNLPALSR